MDEYDVGLLNDWGGGNVAWWHDYLRYEIARANSHWVQQTESLRAELAECREDAERYRWLREKIENDDFVIARVSDWGFTSWSGDDPDRYIDEALAAKGEAK